MGAIVVVPAGDQLLEGSLETPPDAQGVVLFAHGSGSSRHSPRNQAVAAHLTAGGMATLLIDLLTAAEEREEAITRHHRFDIDLLVRRLEAATEFLAKHPETADLPVGYFGASTGAAAALACAARLGDAVRAVVSRGGRPDLAGAPLAVVTAPTLLIVGGNDGVVVDLNRQAANKMLKTDAVIEIVPGASHLFEEPGALDRVAELAAAWFRKHLPNPRANARDAGA